MRSGTKALATGTIVWLFAMSAGVTGCTAKKSEEQPPPSRPAEQAAPSPAPAPTAEPKPAPAEQPPARTVPEQPAPSPDRATPQPGPKQAPSRSTPPSEPPPPAPAQPIPEKPSAPAETKPAPVETDRPQRPQAEPKQPAARELVFLRRSPLGAVRLQHALHAERAANRCAACHHPSRPQKPATAPQQACSDCHTKAATPPMKTKYQAAFHNPTAQSGTCIDCHKSENAKGKKAPVKCTECHRKDGQGG